MKIFILDDDEALSSIISKALEKEGFTTLLSTTGRDGLNKIKSELPDLVLLDQVLPDMSGNDVLKALKVDEQTKNIPVMVLSNFSQEDLVNQAINEGATDYIFKYQVEVSDIVGKVREALKPKESQTL